MDLGFVAQPLFLLYFLATMPCDQLAVFSCCRLSFVTTKGKVTPGIMHTFSGRKGGHKWEVKKPWTREAWTFSKGEKPWPPLRSSRRHGVVKPSTAIDRKRASKRVLKMGLAFPPRGGFLRDSRTGRWSRSRTWQEVGKLVWKLS